MKGMKKQQSLFITVGILIAAATIVATAITGKQSNRKDSQQMTIFQTAHSNSSIQVSHAALELGAVSYTTFSQHGRLLKVDQGTIPSISFDTLDRQGETWSGLEIALFGFDPQHDALDQSTFTASDIVQKDHEASLIVSSADAAVTSPSLPFSTIKIQKTLQGSVSPLVLENQSHLLIQNCRIHDTNTVAIVLRHCHDIVISECSISNVLAGIVVESSFSIQILDTVFAGIGANGDAIRFSNVSGPFNWIAGNMVLNEKGMQQALDLEQSGGTQDSPMLVERNVIDGHYDSAGGILVGYRGSEFITVQNNLLVDPGSYGIAVAGGSHITVQRNRIFGQQSAKSNVGIYVWNQAPPSSRVISVLDNAVHWKNSKGSTNPFWDGENIDALQVSNLTLVAYNPPPIRHLGHPQDILEYATSSKGTVAGFQTYTRIESASGPIRLFQQHHVWIRACSISGAPIAVHIEQCSHIVVTDCVFSNNEVAVVVEQSENVQILDVEVSVPVSSTSSAILVDATSGLYNAITGNRIDKQGSGAAIELVNSHGSDGDPFRVDRNVVHGGTGGGIVVGYKGGSFILVEQNRLIDPGSFGIGCAGGEHIMILQNTVMGRQQPFTNVGIYLWKQGTDVGHNVSVVSNQIHWVSSSGNDNLIWDGNNINDVILLNNSRVEYSGDLDDVPVPPVTWFPISVNGSRAQIAVSSSVVAEEAMVLDSVSRVVINSCSITGGQGAGLTIRNCSYIVVLDCFIEGTESGIHVLDSNNVEILDASIAHLGRGQGILFDNVQGSHNRITQTQISHTESTERGHAIALRRSNGTEVSHCRIEGGSSSNGGVLMGEDGGSYLTVTNNTLLNPGQYGIAVAGGSHMTVTHNHVQGDQAPYSNVGIYAWNQTPSPSSDITIRFNTVWWINRDGVSNPIWNGNNMDNVVIADNTVRIPEPTAAPPETQEPQEPETTTRPEPTSGPMPIPTQNPMDTIIDGATQPILLRDRSNILIRDCEIRDHPSHNGIELQRCRNVVVVNCTFVRVKTGVYAVDSENVQVIDSMFENMQGPMPRGQAVQFNKVTGNANRITGNRVLNELGSSNAEDAINLYKTHGAPDGYVVVEHNVIIGGGPSRSGGGIMTGDNGGSYQSARFNVLVDPGQYGMACAGGEHIVIEYNRVFGKQQYFTNVGIYAWKQRAETARDVRIAHNRIHWKNKDGVNNILWDGGNVQDLVMTNNTMVSYDPPLLSQWET